MGANFQVFLIARVSDRRDRYIYQCVGAFNHFYCFGIQPLRALCRFFSLLKVRENAALVRDELRLFGEWNLLDDPPETWMNPAVPCPYAVSLLSIAWTTDLELEKLPYLSNYSLGNGVMDAKKDCWHRASQGVDQEGMCVIDISNIETPAYCFVRKPGAETHTAWQYLRGVYPSRFARYRLDWPFERAVDKEHEDKRFTQALEAFWALVDVAGYPLIPTLTLLRIWPESVINTPEVRQIKVPTRDDLPMPLDAVVSLYLGLTDRAFPAAFARMFKVDEPHVAIGKAILPPYQLGSPEETFRRTYVIRAILADCRPFHYVLDPPYLTSNGMYPPYSLMGEYERASHWFNEYLRAVDSDSPRTPHHPPRSRLDEGCLPPFFSSPWTQTPEQFRALMASEPLVQRLKSILSPGEVIKATCERAFRMDIDEEDPVLDCCLYTLLLGLLEDGDATFLDLSGLDLSPLQIIKLLIGIPGVEALSLSNNAKVQPEHLPAILTSAPSLRRIHCMHWNVQMVSHVQHIRSAHPEVFQQLECLTCPPFLSCHYVAPPVISFAFHHKTRVSVDDSPFISLPFFTPSQVVRSLTNILPLAFQEHRFGESSLLWKQDLQLAMQTGPYTDANPSCGLPFHMASPMFIRAALSGGTREPGHTWNERPIVGVPPHGGDFDLSQVSDRGIWVFHFDWDHSRRRFRVPGRNQWGFIHYEVAERCTIPVGLAPGDPGRAEIPQADFTPVHKKPRHAGTFFLFTPGPTHDRLPEHDFVSGRPYASFRSTRDGKPDSDQKAAPPKTTESTSREKSQAKRKAQRSSATQAAQSASTTKRPGVRKEPPPASNPQRPPADSPLSAPANVSSPGPPVNVNKPPQHPHSSSASPGSPSAESSENRTSPKQPRKEREWIRFVGTVYDLRGFLRCMADEGRALPDGEAVERLERILNMRDPVTSETLICDLMAQDAELPLSGWRRTRTTDERKERFYREYGSLDPGPDGDFWTPTVFPARVPRGASSVEEPDSDSENYFLPMF